MTNASLASRFSFADALADPRVRVGTLKLRTPLEPEVARICCELTGNPHRRRDRVHTWQQLTRRLGVLKQQQQLENTALECHLAMGQGRTTRALDEAEAASLSQSPATGTSGDSSIRVMMPPSHLEPEGDYAEADLECMPAFLSDSDSEGITMAAVAAAALVKALSQAGHALTVTTLGDSRVCVGASPDHKRVRHAGTDVATWRPVADLLRDHTHVDLMLRHKVGRPLATASATAFGTTLLQSAAG